MMNKNFIFISDFDGTLTDKDFYQIIIDSYLGEKGMELYKAWKKKEYNDIDFLGLIFQSINRNEEEILLDILSIPFDEYAKDFIHKIKASGGEFAVLSAGTSYYIDRLFDKLGISGIQIFSNEGYYHNKGIHMKVAADGPFYSEIYGIDKAKVVAKLKQQYDIVYFAGDSEPDLKPALLADIIFAKGVLQEMLKEKNHPFVPIKNFKEIENYLLNQGVIKNEGH